MKITNNKVENVRVLTIDDSSKSKDGKATYWKLGVMIGSTVGMVKCNDDVAEIVKPNGVYDLEATYDDTYETVSYKFTRVLREHPQNAGTGATATK